MKKQIRNFIFLSLVQLCGSNFTNAQVGLLTLTDNLSMSSSSSYEVEIKDVTGPGSGHDQIAIGGDLTLDGILNIELNGYTPVVTDEFEILSYDGTISGTFSTINWPNEMTNQGWSIDYGVLSTGKITIHGPSSILPVEFISFSIDSDIGVNRLSWVTATEINNDYFSVEVSEEGAQYSTLGRVNSKEQNDRNSEYSYEHKTDVNGLLYYRLKQVDLDGKYEYSDIVSINSRIGENTSFYPNPTAGIVHFSAAQSGLYVYNQMGKEILNIDDQNTTYDLSTLPTGIFLIRTKGSNSITARLIINK